jgi:hypothetical protein
VRHVFSPSQIVIKYENIPKRNRKKAWNPYLLM